MSGASRARSDLLIAAVIAAVIESVLTVCGFVTAGKLDGRHVWLEISQMPGAQISEQLFHRVGWLQAIVSAFIIQWLLFGAVIVALTNFWRAIARGVQEEQGNRSVG